jgi:hypothetical protein
MNFSADSSSAAYGGNMATPAPLAWTDPREDIGYSVRMADGRLAPRAFADRAAAEAWARPEDGDQVVSFNRICECDS